MSTAESAPPQFTTFPTRKFLSDEQRAILRKSAMCQKLSSDQVDYFFEVVERTKLDPFTGQIRPDIRRARDEEGQKIPTLIIITTLQGLRAIGDRSGQLDGESGPEWCAAEDESETKWKDVWLSKDPPAAARASVYRKDRPRAQTAVVRWDAFVQLTFDKQGNLTPGPFWKKMGSHMLGKCALAAGYRGAFPNQCSGLYISEEIGEELDPDSEEAIEAEMLRRARSEREYWDQERTKGNLPIDEAQRAQGIFPRSEQSPIAQPPIARGGSTPLVDRPAEPPRAHDWEFFVIRRIEYFKGRTIGSLTPAELQGLGQWMAKVEKAWPGLDEDLKSHYKAIKARMDYEGQVAAFADGLDFSPTPTRALSDDWKP